MPNDSPIFVLLQTETEFCLHRDGMENGGAYREEPAVNHRETELDLWSDGVTTFGGQDHHGV